MLPPDGAEYPLILRGETYLWWRSLLGALFGLSLFLLLTAVVSQALVTLFWATTGERPGVPGLLHRRVRLPDARSACWRSTSASPRLIPIAWGLVMVVHQVRPRWLSSVGPGIRWRYLLGCLAIAAVALNGALLLSTMVQEPLKFGVQQGFWGFLVVIVLTSPIQAVAEEIFFRGYLMQALGSLVRTPWFGVIVSSVVFALLHGTQNLPLFVDRLAFGLLAAILVWRTGGLEAGIAAHVINNVCAYLIAGSDQFDRRAQGDQGDRLARRRLRRRRLRPLRRCWRTCSGPGSSCDAGSICQPSGSPQRVGRWDRWTRTGLSPGRSLQ